METVALNTALIHVLNMASHIKTEKSFLQLQEQLAKFYTQLVDEGMDSLWESGEWNDQKLESLRHAHLRTPYK